MQTVAELIQGAPVWVNPDHRVSTAILLMRGHKVQAIPVLDNHTLVGLLTPADLMSANPAQLAAELMRPAFATVTPDTTVRDAADLLTGRQLEALVVVDESNAILGTITCRHLLPALRFPIDAITDLPWSDSLREWAIEKLKDGREVSVLFLDLDGFGKFNKLHGHLTGDAVLKTIGESLLGLSDADTEFVCRYGGDEFGIATLRTSEEAQDLGAQIEAAIPRIQFPDAANERVSVTVGHSGGLRTKKREQTHYVSMVNNLIGIASRDCMRKKNEKQR